MDDMMQFPKTVEEFMEQYKIVDTEQIYTNGAELVPIFRMKQWFDYIKGILSASKDDDTISRQAAIEEVHRAIYEFFDICEDDEESPMTYKDEKLLEINKVITIRIKQLPSAQTETKKGKWIKENVVLTTDPPQYRWHCSECGKSVYGFSSGILTFYCPNCGAKMEAEE